VTQAVSNSTISHVGIIVGVLLFILAMSIAFTKVRTTLRLYRVYKHHELGDKPSEEGEKEGEAKGEAPGGSEDDSPADEFDSEENEAEAREERFGE
jgi:hypothetical protein